MSMIAGRRLALLLAALTLSAAGAADAAEQVKVGLDLTVSGYHAPWMVAQRKGYFTEQGLDVAIGRGFGSGDTVKLVASGEIDVGFHHTANLIIANSEGADLRVVMSYLVQELCGAFSAAEDGNVTTGGSAGPLSNSYYGTADQGGNLWEWNEALSNGGQTRGGRGGLWLLGDSFFLRASTRRDFSPADESSVLGFRVATIPEPNTAVLAVLAVGLFSIAQQKRVRH